MASRKHTASRWYALGSVSLKCNASDCSFLAYEGTLREKEDAFRAHRVEMGETVAPRKPSALERKDARISELEAENTYLLVELWSLRRTAKIVHHYCQVCAHALVYCACRKEES